MIGAEDVGGARDTVAALDALSRMDGWARMTDDMSLYVDRAVQRIIQPDCPDRERAELAGEVRAYQRIMSYPQEEVTRLMAQLATT
jgi:hypothetical protein